MEVSSLFSYDYTYTYDLSWHAMRTALLVAFSFYSFSNDLDMCRRRRECDSVYREKLASCLALRAHQHILLVSVN